MNLVNHTPEVERRDMSMLRIAPMFASAAGEEEQDKGKWKTNQGS
jgi:hypothetical protein